jgi:mono/diheme cytochrome c family protein
MRWTNAVAAASLLYLGGVALSRGEDVPNLADPNVIAAGRKVFLETHCSKCHGPDGDGGVNLTQRQFAAPKDVFDAIAEGREKGGLRMPAFRGTLSDQDIWLTAAYVLSLTSGVK